MDLSIYKSSAPTFEPNKLLIPVNNFSFDDEGIKAFNDIYRYCLEMEEGGLFERFVLTPSGGISIKIENIRGPRWNITNGKSFGEIIIKDFDGRFYRFIIGHRKKETTTKSMVGRKAFIIYKDELEKDGVDLMDLCLSIEEGKRQKMMIPAPMIDLLVPPIRTYMNVHHVDLNSAFNAGMIKAFPILDKTVRRMYNMRKDKPIYKDVLNMTQGFMQSSLVMYRLSHISRAGYEFTNIEVQKMSEKLENNGYRILAYNTDGIWYQGDEPYEDESFGSDIGQWKTDHKYCKIRFRSKGAYEFVEDGFYTPVVRGQLACEKKYPRNLWTWDDNILFRSDPIMISFVEGSGYQKNVDYEQ